MPERAYASGKGERRTRATRVQRKAKAGQDEGFPTPQAPQRGRRPRSLSAAIGCTSGQSLIFAPAKIRATGTVGHQSRFWCQRIELQGADRRVSCHQKQGVLSRGSVVQAIAFAGLRSGRAAARATAPAPTGKPTVKPWARAACPSVQPVPDRSAAGFCTGGEWASSNRSNGRTAPGARC